MIPPASKSLQRTEWEHIAVASDSLWVIASRPGVEAAMDEEVAGRAMGIAMIQQQHVREWQDDMICGVRKPGRGHADLAVIGPGNEPRQGRCRYPPVARDNAERIVHRPEQRIDRGGTARDECGRRLPEDRPQQ